METRIDVKNKIIIIDVYNLENNTLEIDIDSGFGILVLENMKYLLGEIFLFIDTAGNKIIEKEIKNINIKTYKKCRTNLFIIFT